VANANLAERPGDEATDHRRLETVIDSRLVFPAIRAVNISGLHIFARMLEDGPPTPEIETDVVHEIIRLEFL